MTEHAPLSRAMTAAECRELLEGQRVCVVSLVDAGEPYAVPVFYGLDGDALVLGLSEGRKTRALDRDPRVCVTVTEVRPDGFWRSVQVRGVVRWLTSEMDRVAAIEALVAHNRRLRTPAVGASAASGAAATAGAAHRAVAPGRLGRVERGEVTGRARAGMAGTMETE